MVSLMSLVPRDQALDSELESGAHMTLILVATGLAFLFTATAIIFYLFPVCRVMRRTLFPKPLVNDSSQMSNKNRVTIFYCFRLTVLTHGHSIGLSTYDDLDPVQADACASSEVEPTFLSTRIENYLDSKIPCFLRYQNPEVSCPTSTWTKRLIHWPDTRILRLSSLATKSTPCQSLSPTPFTGDVATASAYQHRLTSHRRLDENSR
jgi:hypothetical protein